MNKLHLWLTKKIKLFAFQDLQFFFPFKVYSLEEIPFSAS